MEELGVGPRDRRVVGSRRGRRARGARETGKGNDGIFCGAAIELADGTIVTGKNSPLMHAASSLVLNAVKQLAGIPDAIHLLSPSIIESVGAPQEERARRPTSISLDLEETLIALAHQRDHQPDGAGRAGEPEAALAAATCT